LGQKRQQLKLFKALWIVRHLKNQKPAAWMKSKARVCVELAAVAVNFYLMRV
jgi:hypothetical protein